MGKPAGIPRLTWHRVTILNYKLDKLRTPYFIHISSLLVLVIIPQLYKHYTNCNLNLIHFHLLAWCQSFTDKNKGYKIFACFFKDKLIVWRILLFEFKLLSTNCKYSQSNIATDNIMIIKILSQRSDIQSFIDKQHSLNRTRDIILK